MRHLILTLLWCLAAAALAAQTAGAVPADLLIVNAKISTLDAERPEADAIAIGGNKILKVGSGSELASLRGPGTRIVDAGGRRLIPGLFDSHLHIIRGGRFYNTELRWDGVRSLRRALDMLREQARRTPPGQWVRVVGGWSPHQFVEKRFPTLEEINEATGNVPAFLLYLYGHAYLNKAGLQTLGIDGNTPNPPGGLIEKDANGQPTGLLVAEPNAFLLYSTLAKLPELGEAEKTNSTHLFMLELNRLGLTAAMDAGGGFQNFPDDYGITDSLCTVDGLTLRLPYFLFAQKAGKELGDYDRWIRSVEIGQGCDDHDHSTEYYVQGGGENLVMSAADFENFDQPRPELSPAMEGQLKAVLSLLVKNRWPFRIHATYNESITRFLNVIEDVNRETPLNGLLWFFDHAETISEDNLRRVKALGGGVAVQYRMAFQGESFIRRYGKKAAEATPPVKKMLEMGISVGMGSDGTRVSSFSPWIGLYWLTTGKTVGGTQLTSRENLLDRSEALRLYTRGSAQLAGLQNDRGMLKAGYLADLCLLSADYFTVPEEDMLRISSVLTIVDGRPVYGAGEFAKLAPPVPDAIPAWSPVNFYGGYQDK